MLGDKRESRSPRSHFTHNWCQAHKPRPAPHCRLLSPGKFNGMIPEPLPIYSKNLMTDRGRCLKLGSNSFTHSQPHSNSGHKAHPSGWRFGLVVTRTLASINVVALRQTRLVLGWVTVCGRVNHFGM